MEIKRGTTRLVILIGKYVIKMPNFTFSWKNFIIGILSNLNENDTYKTHLILGTSHLLAPVRVNLLGLILIMDRAEPIKYLPDLNLFEDNNLLGDDKPNNFGMLNGKIVKIDYGSLN